MTDGRRDLAGALSMALTVVLVSPVSALMLMLGARESPFLFHAVAEGSVVLALALCLALFHGRWWRDRTFLRRLANMVQCRH